MRNHFQVTFHYDYLSPDIWRYLTTDMFGWVACSFSSQGGWIWVLRYIFYEEPCDSWGFTQSIYLFSLLRYSILKLRCKKSSILGRNLWRLKGYGSIPGTTLWQGPFLTAGVEEDVPHCDLILSEWA